MTVYSPFISLLLFFFLFSCRPIDRHILVHNYWQLESIATPAHLIGEQGAMDQMDHCEKDDAWKFTENGLLKIYRGSDRCRQDENFTDCLGGWTLAEKKKQLTIRESGGFKTTYQVRNLTPAILQLSFSSDEGEVILTYKSIRANQLARKE